jgi:hypothetical protein
MSEIEFTDQARSFFTAPFDPVTVRRGDALGLRGSADELADSVAPGLSNRIRDGRWITILAWCLARSQEVFHASGGRGVSTRAQQQDRYSWLRPLELMWVARTVALAGEDWKTRPLAGQRRVRPWHAARENGHELPDRFGMSSEQFRAYRQTGLYGGYRRAFRKWQGLTMLGDGWTPGRRSIALADWLDDRLGAARPAWPLHQGDVHPASPLKRKPKLGNGDKHDWWLRNWTTFDQPARSADAKTLPRPKRDHAALPESAILSPAVFGGDPAGQRRRAVAIAIERSRTADHLAACEHLAATFAKDSAIPLLPPFSRLADAGMAVMDLIADELRKESSISLAHVAGRPEAKELCNDLYQAARAWPRGGGLELRNIEAIQRFAATFASRKPIDSIRALIEHHELYGGGLRWFVLRGERIEPRTPPGIGSARYRFRLFPLCRLAAQCDVLRRMPTALVNDVEAADDQDLEERDV